MHRAGTKTKAGSYIQKECEGCGDTHNHVTLSQGRKSESEEMKRPLFYWTKKRLEVTLTTMVFNPKSFIFISPISILDKK